MRDTEISGKSRTQGGAWEKLDTSELPETTPSDQEGAVFNLILLTHHLTVVRILSLRNQLIFLPKGEEEER